MKNNKIISVIIPTFNEEKVIASCLISLTKQSYQFLEIIVVDDGSQDKTVNIIENLKFKVKNLKLLNQKHLGPGPARNLGAKYAQGEILVFVDADMIFDKSFVKDLTRPILEGKAIGTFSKNEFVKNQNAVWSICWNLNKNLPKERMIPNDYPARAPVFRAILKKEFDNVNGFDSTGEYTDDWSLSRKLGKKSTLAKGAIYYHYNPRTLREIYKQARWIGKNYFISGNLIRRVRSLILYSFPFSLLTGFLKSARQFFPPFLIFKLVYDAGIYVSVVGSFFNEKKAK